MQHTFTLHRKSVRVSVTHGGKQYRKATGLTVADTSLWNPKAKSLKAKCKDARILPDLLTINTRLCEKEEKARTEKDVLEAIDYALGKEKEPEGVPTFWQYFEEWGERPSTSQRQRALAVRTVARLMGRTEDWADIDTAYWFRLQRKMEDEGMSANYRWNIGSRLRAAVHEGYTLKYHKNDDFREFKARREQVDAVILSPSEIELLWDWQPTSRFLGRVRDLGLIGYYSASRFSDYSRLTMANVREGHLEFTQQKTGDKVVIPASPRLVSLLERNGGHAPSMCSVVFNRKIKDVAKYAGITGVVKLKGEEKQRYDGVQSHTFRRSALSNLHAQGLPLRDCMAISGHKTLSAIQAYLRLDEEESVKRLDNLAFFK